MFLQELVKFHSQYNHCDVSPDIHKTTHTNLGIWCESQRRSYLVRQHLAATGEKLRGGLMTDDQYLRLQRLGFRFDKKGKRALRATVNGTIHTIHEFTSIVDHDQL
jgi:hypothetical protein